MRRFIRFVVNFGLFFGSLQAIGQTPTPIPITGNLGSISGSSVPYSGVLIQLQNCASPVLITGYWGIVAQTYQIQANSSGAINSTIWPNDLITCNGTTGASQYSYQTVVQGVPSGSVTCYQVTSTQGIWNINTQQPVACGYTPPNPQDASYRNINSTGFFSGNNGFMSGTWTLGSLSGSVGKCVQIGSSGLLTASSGACNIASSGVSQIIAGTNVTVSPIGGTGAVTINAAGGSGAVNQLVAGTGISLSPSGGTGTVTITNTGSLSGSFAPYGGAPGIQYNVSPTAGRLATSTDLQTIFGYSPLNPSNNLSDVSSSSSSLSNLFYNSGIISAPILGTNSGGLPFPVAVGNGLSYSSSGSTGNIQYLILNILGPATGFCPTLSFSGGGGSGAAASLICVQITPPHKTITGYTITNPGSGYTSAPTVTVSQPSAASVTAVLGSSGKLNTSWLSGTTYSVAGTPLPACSSTYLLNILAVSDASSITAGATYVGSSTYTTTVKCVFNSTGSVYTWIID